MQIGSASSTAGETESGWLEITQLPTGGAERIPVTITDGEADGPTVWVTAALHGNEVTGIAAAHDVVTEALRADLQGTLVTVPILNPSGVRLDQRNSYYHDDDPNRSFPYDVEERSSPAGVQARINERIFAALEETADALISLHEGWINEALYTIVERVRYGRERTAAAAETLARETEELAAAFGLPAVREHDVDVQLEYGLQRSFECAAVNAAGIPAITPELGSPHVIEEDYRRAAVTGIRNVLRSLGMLPGPLEAHTHVPDAPVEYPVKRVDGPSTEAAGIVRHRVEVGDVVAAGDPIADITTPHGSVEATVESNHAGYILGRRHGVATYENDTLVSMAARDRGSLVVEREGRR